MTKLLAEKKFLVRFGDCDPAGIVFYARYFDWAHAAIEDFWSSRPEGWKRWFQNSDFAVPLRHADADFMAPVRAGEELICELYLARVGETSIAFEMRFLRGGVVAAVVKTAHVFVSKSNFKSQAVPPEILRELE